MRFGGQYPPRNFVRRTLLFSVRVIEDLLDVCDKMLRPRDDTMSLVVLEPAIYNTDNLRSCYICSTAAGCAMMNHRTGDSNPNPNP